MLVLEICNHFLLCICYILPCGNVKSIIFASVLTLKPLKPIFTKKLAIIWVMSLSIESNFDDPNAIFPQQSGYQFSSNIYKPRAGSLIRFCADMQNYSWCCTKFITFKDCLKRFIIVGLKKKGLLLWRKWAAALCKNC